MSQTLNDVKNSTVRVLGDGKFSGTGFFITEEYCVTCHHVICDHDEIKIEHEQRKYNTKWIEEYSVLENDIAILKVNKPNVLPLECAKEATPGWFHGDARGFSGQYGNKICLQERVAWCCTRVQIVVSELV